MPLDQFFEVLPARWKLLQVKQQHPNRRIGKGQRQVANAGKAIQHGTDRFFPPVDLKNIFFNRRGTADPFFQRLNGAMSNVDRIPRCAAEAIERWVGPMERPT
ncbi:MAG: hypothetical protein MPW14_07435 [Candidatus Manganitrophus sp.]|nr:MAG: hypothetical protein MPW14_07435 [Candidatus Manganitrophus sp.]